MSAQITPIFANLIYRVNLSEFVQNNAALEKTAIKLYKKSKEKTVSKWSCNTFSTLFMMNFNEDLIFREMLSKIIHHVSVFANEFSAEYNGIECSNSWINLAKPGAFQELHTHPKSHFSSIYYVKVPENCGSIIFQSHECFSDMFEFPTKEHRLPNHKRYIINPKECDLLIFRSNLPHMVNANSSKQNRISISSNFILHNN
jgi:uncharacterized protein (TIGR02466 family)